MILVYVLAFYISVTFFVLLFRFIVPYFCLSVSKAHPSWLSCSRCRNIAMTTWTSWNHSTKLCFSSTNVSQLPPLFYLHTVELWSVIDDVITEQAILKWYQDSHLQKGKSVFLKEMKPMVDWLLTAEEESDSETAAPNSWIIMYYLHTRSRMRIGVFLFCLFARQECSWSRSTWTDVDVFDSASVLRIAQWKLWVFFADQWTSYHSILV